MQIPTKQIPANNKAGYVIVNADDTDEVTSKWGVKVPSKSAEAVKDETEVQEAPVTLLGGKKRDK